MTCQTAVSLGVYVLGAADTSERLRVEAHLPGCAACRAELARLAPLPGLLARVPPDLRPARLLPARPLPARLRPGRWPPRPAFAAARSGGCSPRDALAAAHPGGCPPRDVPGRPGRAGPRP